MQSGLCQTTETGAWSLSMPVKASRMGTIRWAGSLARCSHGISGSRTPGQSLSRGEWCVAARRAAPAAQLDPAISQAGALQVATRKTGRASGCKAAKTAEAAKGAKAAQGAAGAQACPDTGLREEARPTARRRHRRRRGRRWRLLVGARGRCAGALHAAQRTPLCDRSFPGGETRCAPDHCNSLVECNASNCVAGTSCGVSISLIRRVSADQRGEGGLVSSSACGARCSCGVPVSLTPRFLADRRVASGAGAEAAPAAHALPQGGQRAALRALPELPRAQPQAGVLHAARGDACARPRAHG